MAEQVLTRRALNRATLARQMLLARTTTTALDAIERLAGLQAQIPKPPFVGLWTRLEGFRREHLCELYAKKKAVRATLMRGTIHAVSTRDLVRFRGPIQPALDRGMKSIVGKRIQGYDVGRVVDTSRAFFEAQPATFDLLREHIASQHADGDVRALALAVRCLLPLVLVPTDTAWSFPGAADFTTAERWLGRPVPVAADDAPDALVLRYLAAFGPATVTDAQTWSGLAGLRATFERLRPKLVTFRDERKRELFDLPDAPRPPEDALSPVRFLPAFDNLLLGHDDRTRVVADEHRAAIFEPNLNVLSSVLVDGFVAGRWHVERKKATATLVVETFVKAPKRLRSEIADEGMELVRFLEFDADELDVRFEEVEPAAPRRPKR